jgi:hypothetical protein
MTLDKDFYTVPEIAEMIRQHRGRVPDIYSEIRLGNLKATKRRSPSKGRICKVIAQAEAERFLKRLGINGSIASVEAHAHLSTPLRSVALVAVREYLATVPNKTREDEALQLLLEALPGKMISMSLRTSLGKQIVEDFLLLDRPNGSSRRKKKIA